MALDSDISDFESLTRRKKLRTLDEEPEFGFRRPAGQTSSQSETEWLPGDPPLDAEGSRETPQIAKQSEAEAEKPKSGGWGNNWIIKRGHGVSYAGLFLFSLLLFFRPYELSPSLLFLSSAAFWIAVLTLAIFLPTQLALEGNLTDRPKEVNLVLLLVLMALLSIPLAIDPALAWDTFFNKEFIRAVLMFVVLVNVVRTEKRLKALIFLSLAVTVYLSVHALRDYMAGRFTGFEMRIWGALGGMFGNPNDLAIHLVTMVPIAIGLLLASRNLAKKAMYGICALLALGAVVVTFSRGGFLGLMFALGVLAWKLGRRHRFIMTIVMAVVLALFLVAAPGNYGLRMASIFNSDLDSSGSAQSRTELLKISAKVALRHPLLGIGMGNFSIVGIHDQVSHNSYTQVATEMGLAAAVFYVMLLVVPIKRLRQIERETIDADRKMKRFYYLSIGLQAGLIGYMASSFFASVAYQFYAYYLVGYAICLRRIYLQESAANQTQTTSVWQEVLLRGSKF
jgi:putative inorganic carbon (HCO3(-)) transporter